MFRFRFRVVLTALLFVSASMPVMAATGCDSLWAQVYARTFGLANCDVVTVACDADEDGADDDLCTVNELLDEFHEDPLFGERVDTNADGIPDTLPGDIVPAGGDGSLNTVAVPLCADGGSTCPGEELRCVDGTRPVYYVDPADDLDSNQWLFTFQGGGSCGENSLRTGGEDCWHKYVGSGREQMSTATLVGNTVRGQRRTIKVGGIHDDRPLNEFTDYHRVKIDKCSFDRSTGRIMRTDWVGPQRGPDGNTVSGRPRNAVGDEFNLSFHGWLIVEAVLADLQHGKSVDVYADGTTVLLPALHDAELVLLAGHSGGSSGLTSKVDRMADHIANWGGTTQVRALFDARGKPGLDHEAALSFGAAGDNMYDFNTGGVSCDALVDNCLPANPTSLESSYDDSYYASPGGQILQFTYWDVEFDDSCMALHPLADAWRCLDATHVLYNHLATPFFMRQAQRDRNHVVHGPEFALDPTYTFDSNQYRVRAVRQLLSMRDERDKAVADRDWEEPIYGWAQPVEGLGIFAPNVTVHSGLFDDAQFFSTYLEDAGGVTCVSYHDALFSWLNGGGDQVWVEGVDGVGRVAACP